jgi:hypothetical protein
MYVSSKLNYLVMEFTRDCKGETFYPLSIIYFSEDTSGTAPAIKAQASEARVCCVWYHELCSVPTYTRALEHTPGAHKIPRSITRNSKLKVTTANNRHRGARSWILGICK